MEINGFDKLEELQKEFPIGTVVKWAEPRTYAAFFYSGKDLQLLQEQKDIASSEIIGDDMVKITTKRRPDITVEGYIFDGAKWWPAYNTWDGWVEWREKD